MDCVYYVCDFIFIKNEVLLVRTVCITVAWNVT